MKTIFHIVEYSPWIKGLMTPMLGVDGTRLRASASGLGAQHERLPGQAWLVAGGARPERGCGSHLRESDRARRGQSAGAAESAADIEAVAGEREVDLRCLQCGPFEFQGAVAAQGVFAEYAVLQRKTGVDDRLIAQRPAGIQSGIDTRRGQLREAGGIEAAQLAFEFEVAGFAVNFALQGERGITCGKFELLEVDRCRLLLQITDASAKGWSTCAPPRGISQLSDNCLR